MGTVVQSPTPGEAEPRLRWGWRLLFGTVWIWLERNLVTVVPFYHDPDRYHIYTCKGLTRRHHSLIICLRGLLETIWFRSRGSTYQSGLLSTCRWQKTAFSVSKSMHISSFAEEDFELCQHRNRFIVMYVTSSASWWQVLAVRRISFMWVPMRIEVFGCRFWYRYIDLIQVGAFAFGRRYYLWGLGFPGPQLSSPYYTQPTNIIWWAFRSLQPWMEPSEFGQI